MCLRFWIKQGGPCSSELKTCVHGGMQGLYTGCGLQGSSGRWISGRWAFGCSQILPGFSNSRDRWFKTYLLPQNYEPYHCYTILDDVWLTSWYEQMGEREDLNLFPIPAWVQAEAGRMPKGVMGLCGCHGYRPWKFSVSLTVPGVKLTMPGRFTWLPSLGKLPGYSRNSAVIHQFSNSALDSGVLRSATHNPRDSWGICEY